MSETTDTITKKIVEGFGLVEHEDTPGVVIQESIRVMTPEEIKERDALNIANTASAVRKRVLQYHAKHNGKGGT